MMRLILGLLAGALVGLSASAVAQTSGKLVADLNKARIPLSSDPSRGVDLNGTCIFAATTANRGREIFRLNAGGLSLLKDIFPGRASSNPTQITLCGNRVFFVADNGRNGRELWVTDGTPQGTKLVRDLEPGAASSDPRQLECCNGRLFFSAFTCKAGREIYVSDGSFPGTRLILDIRPGLPSSMGRGPIRCCGNKVFFFADDGKTGLELWVSDGTPARTVLVKDTIPGTSSGIGDTNQLVCCKGKIFFVGRTSAEGNELHSSDGTTGGTGLVKDLFPGRSSAGPRELTCCNGVLYFSAFASINNTRVGTELFKSDGTANGTVLVKDIFVGSSSSFPGSITCCNGKVFFRATASGIGAELFVTDGTANGTILVKDINPGSSSSSPFFMVCCNNQLFFIATTRNDGRELWKSDGTANGTVLIKDLTAGSASTSFRGNVFCHRRQLFFKVLDASVGIELFVTDGTANGTKLFLDIERGTRTESSNARSITCAAPYGIYFVGDLEGKGRELCFWDGASVTEFDIRIGINGSNPFRLTWVGNKLFFGANDGVNGIELWSAVPGEQPKLVANHSPGSTSSTIRDIQRIGDTNKAAVVIGNRADGIELGIANGKFDIIDIFKGGGSSFPTIEPNLKNQSGGNFFVRANDGKIGTEPFLVDSTTNTATGIDMNLSPTSSGGGFVEIRDPVPAGPQERTAFRIKNDTRDPLLVIADKFAKIIARIDTLLSSGNELVFDEIIPLTPNTNNKEYYANGAERSSSGDGTQVFKLEIGKKPKLAHHINPTGSANVKNFTRLGGFIFFTATDGKHGTELWRIDPATATVKLFDILPGFEGSFPRELKVIGCRLWFLANGSDISDIDIYSTDGKTVRKEIDNESSISQNTRPLSELVCCCGSLWYPSYTSANGVELFERKNPGPTVELFGKLCGATKPIARSTPAILGKPMTWSGERGPAGHIGLVYFDAVQKRPVPLFGCDVWINFGTAVLVTGVAAPKYSLTIPVPNDNALNGAKIIQQTLWVPATVLPFVSTNGVLLGVSKCD